MTNAAPLIGFVGLGNMGRHMARRLAEAGHKLIAFDINEAACAEAARHGMEIAGSPREVADRAGIVVRLIIDLSTVGPALAENVAASLAARNIEYLDAPVSGGTTGAAAGTLAIMLAGPDVALAQAEPLLAVLARSQTRVGTQAGQAQLAKLINNMLFGTHLVAALEAMAMGVKGGLDPTRLLAVINASSGRSYITETRIGQAVLHRDHQVRFATGLLHKDLQLGLAAAKENGARLWINKSTGEFLSQAMEKGFAPRDYTAMIEMFEEWNGVSVLVNPAQEQT
jgi:3-hydroxyisobutyrate dehydrogenase